MNPPESVEDLKKYILREIPEDTFYRLWFTLRKR